jgi:hypothetical protein
MDGYGAMDRGFGVPVPQPWLPDLMISNPTNFNQSSARNPCRRASPSGDCCNDDLEKKGARSKGGGGVTRVLPNANCMTYTGFLDLHCCSPIGAGKRSPSVLTCIQCCMANMIAHRARPSATVSQLTQTAENLLNIWRLFLVQCKKQKLDI